VQTRFEMITALVVIDGWLLGTLHEEGVVGDCAGEKDVKAAKTILQRTRSMVPSVCLFVLFGPRKSAVG
jgi:hypothetical protein